VLLNNAATTPPFHVTLERVREFLQTYSTFHRGVGLHAGISFQKVTTAIETIRRFLGVRDGQSVLFTHNTSSAIGVFARLLHLRTDDIVITSVIEHTSNHLPWRFNTSAKAVYVNAFHDGSLDYADLEAKMKQYASRLKVIAITGASSLPGYIPGLPRIAQLAHEYHALLFVDAAQLAPHRPINIEEIGVDVLALSAHKLYAPFGLGVLVVPQKLLAQAPLDPGGGSIHMINEANEVMWASPDMRRQVGTWNVIGIVALAASCQTIMDIGWEQIVAHEKALTQYSAQALATVPGLTLYVPPEKYIAEDRIGTFPFNLNGYHHALLSAILAHEYGIENRAGTICMHCLVRRWCGVGDEEQRRVEAEIQKGNLLASYGIVRVSLGLHNTSEDIDILCGASKHIAQRGAALRYKPVTQEGVFVPL